MLATIISAVVILIITITSYLFTYRGYFTYKEKIKDLAILSLLVIAWTGFMLLLNWLEMQVEKGG